MNTGRPLKLLKVLRFLRIRRNPEIVWEPRYGYFKTVRKNLILM